MRWFLSAFTMVACVMTAIAAPGQGPAFEETPFGKTPEGVPITAYTLINKNGVKVKVITYGGIIAEFHAPDKDGKFADIVLGFDDLKGYTDGHPFFGAITGRVANRIGNAKFTIDGKEFTIPGGNPHSLHGGAKGFDKRVWKGEASVTPAGPMVKLSYTSKDGEEGYPGELQTVVTYTLTSDNGLKIDYLATTRWAETIHHRFAGVDGLTACRGSVIVSKR